MVSGGVIAARLVDIRCAIDSRLVGSRLVGSRLVGSRLVGSRLDQIAILDGNRINKRHRTTETQAQNPVFL